ncbi:MAG TPA: MBOAT family O-acyltransferase [Gemmatimonadaceae bacterium]
MLFNSTIFLFVFLPIAYAVFWILRSANARYVWLTITGYVFYAYWDPRFTLLMAFSTLVSYTAGLGFLRWDADPRRRKLCLVVPIVTDLTLLGFFKYANFALSTVGATLHWLGGGEVALPHLNVILPIGISFYTFHTIGYIVDSYRRQVRPTRNFFEFAAFVSLFSQLVAGPIVRFRAIEGDLLELGRSERTRWLYRGISFFAYGLVAKVLVADTLGAFVDPALAHYRQLSSLGAWMAMLGYTFQLYFDFDGYSCMAVGLGYLFGLRIPQNFDSPYKSLDPSDFWRRWHISLSACLRDYVYIPLGGSRRGAWRTYRNLLLTMLIGGLWHGAGWTFVVWGAYHGLLLALYKRFGATWDRLPRGARQLGMFLLAVFGWVLFRATDFGMAVWVLRAMVVPTAGVLVLQPALAAALLLLAGWWSLRGPNAYDLHRRPERDRAWRRQVAVAASLGASLAIIIGSRPSPFLYFQF